jgi:hypothetical protein
VRSKVVRSSIRGKKCKGSPFPSVGSQRFVKKSIILCALLSSVTGTEYLCLIYMNNYICALEDMCAVLVPGSLKYLLISNKKGLEQVSNVLPGTMFLILNPG